LVFSASDLRDALLSHAPPEAGGLLIALSGGADSSALLAAAAQLSSLGMTMPVRAIHIDHGLQPLAAAFQESSERLCARLEVTLSCVKVNVEPHAGESLEAVARTARYQAFESELRSRECLLTAHHCEDQAETFLLQALRGSGTRGLSGMPACRMFGKGWHVRPLLGVTRAQLRAFGLAVGAGFVEDGMNQDVHFDRAYLRQTIWPLVEQRWPAAARVLARSARHIAQAQALNQAGAEHDLARLRDGEALSVPVLRALGADRQINALRTWITARGATVPSTAKLTEVLRQVLNARSDKQMAVRWGEFALRRYQNRIYLSGSRPLGFGPALTWNWATQAQLNLGAKLGVLRVVERRGGLHPKFLGDCVMVRARRPGECLKPAARAATQSITHLCQVHGVLPWMRDALPFIGVQESLLAVGNLWLDARYCVDAGDVGIAFAWDNGPAIT
jgi:tRNA(Ile)-lysidine synthase